MCGTDRSMHEHLAIARVLHFMMCYEHLALCNLASAEVVLSDEVIKELESVHKASPNPCP